MKKILSACTVVALLGLAFLPAAPLPETGDYPFLDAIPANAALVIQLKGVEGATSRFNEFLKNALPDLAPMASKQMEGELGTLLEGRKLGCIAKDGPHYMAYLEFPQPNAGGFNPDKDKIMVAVRVASYERFRDEVLKEEERKTLKAVEPGVEMFSPGANEHIYMVSRKEQVLFTPSKEIASRLAKKPLGISGKISKGQLARLHASDLGLFLNLDTLNKDYANMIEQGKKDIDQAVQAMEFLLPKEQQSSMVMIRGVVAGAFQALQDSKGFIAGMEFRPSGIVGHAQLELRAGSVTSGLLQGSKASGFAGLGSLPSGHGFYSAMQTDIPLLKKVIALSFGTTADEEGKEIAKVVEAFLNSQVGVRYDAMSLPPEGIQVVESDDPKLTRAAYVKVFSGMGKMKQFQGVALKKAPMVKAAAEKHQGVSFDQVQLEWDIEKMLAQVNQPGIPMEVGQLQTAMMKKLMGEKMNVWIGEGEKKIIAVYGKDWAEASKILDNWAKPAQAIGGNANFQSARKDLPKEAAFIILADPLAFVRLVVDAVKEMGNALPIPPNMLPNLQGAKVTFCGMAVTLEGDRVGVEGLISSPSVKEFYEKVVKPIIGPLLGQV
ncbi:MAG: hypothetical protein EXR99_07710 [Gemmataceae bacterium]|nr:hypothetical protein [Gemmataceae bacterium]